MTAMREVYKLKWLFFIMQLTSELAEIIGALIGDGYIYNKNHKYQIGFVGHPNNDNLYYKKLKKLIFRVWMKNPKIRIRERGLRMVINSKEIVSTLSNSFNIPCGINKCFNVVIPSQIYFRWDLLKFTLCGIVDTDGSVFVSKKPGVLNYPSIEITTSSLNLANQIKLALIKKGFKVPKIWSYKSKNLTYKVALNGQKNLEKWVNEIGFSNPYKLNRAKKYLKYGKRGS